MTVADRSPDLYRGRRLLNRHGSRDCWEPPCSDGPGLASGNCTTRPARLVRGDGRHSGCSVAGETMFEVPAAMSPAHGQRHLVEMIPLTPGTCGPCPSSYYCLPPSSPRDALEVTFGAGSEIYHDLTWRYRGRSRSRQSRITAIGTPARDLVGDLPPVRPVHTYAKARKTSLRAANRARRHRGAAATSLVASAAAALANRSGTRRRWRSCATSPCLCPVVKCSPRASCCRAHRRCTPHPRRLSRAACGRCSNIPWAD